MKLLLVGDDGTIIDQTDEFTAQEWANMTTLGAYTLLADLPRFGIGEL